MQDGEAVPCLIREPLNYASDKWDEDRLTDVGKRWVLGMNARIQICIEPQARTEFQP